MLDIDKLSSEMFGDFEGIKINQTSSEILNSLKYLQKRYYDTIDQNIILSEKQSKISNEILQIEEELNVSKESKIYYQKSIDLVYENSIGELEKLLNLGMKYIFHDANYRVKLDLSDKRNKSLNVLLVDQNDNELDILDGIGLGMRSVISFIIQIYYLINMGSYPVLFMDEKLTGLSNEYINHFFYFIKSICEQHNFIIVLITHDTRFETYANKIYVVSNGNITEKEIEDYV